MNELIEIPSFSNKEINFVTLVISHINGIRESSIYIPHPPVNDRKLKFEWASYFSKYTDLEVVKGKSSEISISGPISLLLKFIRKNPSPKWNCFISKEREFFYPKNKPEVYDEIYYEIEYYKIREQIISYIEQTFGVNEVLNGIKNLFSTINQEVCISFEDYLEKKSKYLLSLNLNESVLFDLLNSKNKRGRTD